MDWYIPAADAEAVSALRRAVAGYLARHAAPGSDLDGAELAFSELITNAVLHSDRPAWVSVEWTLEKPRVSVFDLGPEFSLDTSLPDDPAAESGRGLFIASHVAEDLAVAHRRGGGNVVTAVLPVTRHVQDSHDPPRSTVGALPTVEEADEDGFGKEPFLRALVVQLAHALETTHGPSAADAAVAQVGTDVGGQMEAEYRRAKDITGKMTPGELADAYVRLKHAIDGGFYVIEESDEKIVLGNTRCPFGDAVKRSPSLCRMTSSVFGGIASRNYGSATVVLEERIAVGDPGCRVTVYLGDSRPDLPHGHVYEAPVAEAS